MGLGNRSARRHDTEGTRKTAGVRSEDFWDFHPGQTVMTVDGFLGKVVAVEDGPHAGSEAYQVRLLNDMGGGLYTSSQLRAATTTTAAAEAANTAARDYPELAEILERRPDPGKYPSSTLGMVASREDPQDDREAMKYHGRDDVTELREDMGLPPLEAVQHVSVAGHFVSYSLAHGMPWCWDCNAPADSGHGEAQATQQSQVRTAAYYTADELREIGREEERRTGKTAEELLRAQAGAWGDEGIDVRPGTYDDDDRYNGVNGPGICENGHLTWGGECPSCRNTDDGKNSIVTNPGDHKPQDVENVKNASVREAAWNDLCEEDEDGYCHYHHMDHDAAGHYADDEENERPEEPMVHCPSCGQWKGKYTDDHPGNDGPCPNASPSEDDIFETLDPTRYCGEHCQSAHASDIAHGVMGHHTFRADEPEYAERGTGLANTTSPYDAPASRDSRYEVRDPDEAGLCRYCRKPLMGSPLDQLDQIGTPSQEHFLRTNPTGPTKYSAVQTMPIEQTHTRTIPEDDDWDSYLITRCGDHGTKVVGDRPSQEAYIEAAQGCHDAAQGEGGSEHRRDHAADGTDCWSCCPDMYVAKPGERESGRTASLRFGLAMIALAQSDPDLGFHLTAAWRDVRDKAKRIRTEGGVHITTAQNGYVIAQVKGDHGTYEAVLMRVPGTQKVGQWDCGCKWAQYHWGAPDDYSRFAGRMCSHALALNFEAQSRGMFGREVTTDQGVPRWLNQGQFERTASTGDDLPFLSVYATLAIAEGQHPDEVARVIASVNSPFGEPGPNPVPHYPATMPRNPSENPASAGFLTAADPAGWDQSNPQSLGDRMATLDDSLFEPEMGKEAFLPLLLEALPAIAEGVGGAGAAAGAGEAAAGGEAAGGSSLLKGVTKLPGLPGTSAPSGGGESSPAKQVHQWAQQDKAEGDDARQQQDLDFNDRIKNFQATLHDEPEPALPSTDGAAEDDEDLFGPQVTASVATGVEYSVPTDAGNSIPTPVSPAPGLKDVADDALSPEDPSMATVGSLSGGVDDIVAQFQRTAGAAVLGNSTGTYEASIQANSEIAAAARQFLQTGEPPMAKEAMAVFSPAEQQALINEGEGVKAANLDRLQIEGTHYEALDAALAKQDGDDEEWMD